MLSSLATLSFVDYHRGRRFNLREGARIQWQQGLCPLIHVLSQLSSRMSQIAGPSGSRSGIALVFVSLTRLPIARIEPFDSDEFGFLDQIAVHWFPMHHTLFMTIRRIFGLMLGDSYRGFVLLDALTSAIRF